MSTGGTLATGDAMTTGGASATGDATINGEGRGENLNSHWIACA